jgi:translation initiation factor 5
MDDDMEKSETERINILHNYIMKKLPAGKTLDIADEKAILIEAERLEIVTKAPMLLCEIVLCELLPDDKVPFVNKMFFFVTDPLTG